MPFYFFCLLVIPILGNGIGMGSQVVFEQVFMSLHAAHDGVPPPDVPEAGMVLFRIGISHRIFQFLGLQFFQHILFNLIIICSAVFHRFFTKIKRILIELRVERHPAHANCFIDQVRVVTVGPLILRRNIILTEMTIVTVLAGVDVVPDGRLLQAHATHPVLGKGNRTPGIHGRQFFLAYVMV